MISITQDYQNDKMVSSSIKNFFKEYKISATLKESNAYKSKGVSVIAIFQYLFMLIFTNRSMYMNILMGTHKVDFGKDTVYRFINSIHINWIRFTTLLSTQIASKTITKFMESAGILRYFLKYANHT